MSANGFAAAERAYLTPPDEHDCPDDPDDCQCAERDEDLREDALLARQEERDGR